MNTPIIRRSTARDLLDSIKRQQQELSKRRAEVRKHARLLRKIDAAARRSGATVRHYVGPHYAMQVMVYLDKVEAFTGAKVARLLSALDDLIPFESSRDERDGRTFEAYGGPFYLRLSISLADPDAGKNCRRVVKSIQPGTPIVEYAYVCE